MLMSQLDNQMKYVERKDCGTTYGWIASINWEAQDATVALKGISVCGLDPGETKWASQGSLQALHKQGILASISPAFTARQSSGQHNLHTGLL
jgi:hypothetical protein